MSAPGDLYAARPRDRGTTCLHARTRAETSYQDSATILCLDCGMRRFSSYSYGEQTLGPWYREAYP